MFHSSTTLITSILLAVLIYGRAVSHQHDPVSKGSCTGEPKTTTGRLKKTLFCGYDTSVRPVLSHTNQTTLQLLAMPIDIRYTMENQNSIWMSFWMYLEWKDELLTWNDTEFDGIKSFESDGSKIWTPDLSITNPPQSVSKQMTCRVNSKGDVNCVANIYITVHCDIDLTYYPYDKHKCSFAFSSRFHGGSVLDLHTQQYNVNYYQFLRRHGYWKLKDLTANRNQTTLYNNVHLVELIYKFIIERQSPTHTVMYATPAFVMMVTVLCVFWVDLNCSARIVLPSFSLLTHMMILQYLITVIQPNAQSPPVLILFFRDSLLLAGLSLVWSVISRALATSPTSPYWLYVISTHLNNNHYAKLLLPHDIFITSGAGDEDESSLVVHRDCVEQQWRMLTLLADRLLFVLSSLVYIFMYIRLVP